MTLDHKVIGVQYLVLILAMFCVGGFDALLIRLELINPEPRFWAPDTYLTLVGLHSTTMIFMGTSAIIGPLGNYLVPLMIGAKRMAYPWLEALSFWLLLLAFAYLTSTLAFGGFPTGWTGYAPLADEAHTGMDSYLVAFILVAAGIVASAIQHAGDRVAATRTGHDLDPVANPRLEHRRGLAAGLAGRPGADRHGHAGLL